MTKTKWPRPTIEDARRAAEDLRRAAYHAEDIADEVEWKATHEQERKAAKAAEERWLSIVAPFIEEHRWRGGNRGYCFCAHCDRYRVAREVAND